MRRLRAILFCVTVLSLVLPPALRGDEMLLLWELDDPMVKVFTGEGQVHISGLPFTTVDAADLESSQAGVRIRAGEKYLDLRETRDPGGESSDVYYLPTLFYDESEPPRVVGSEWSAGPAYAFFDAKDADASLVFMMEIGEYVGDAWIVLAVSEQATLADLQEQKHIVNATYEGHLSPWTGGAFVAPEPSSGLLLLVGAGLLSLRRRRRVRT